MVIVQGNQGDQQVDSAAFADQTLVHAAVQGYSGSAFLSRMTASLKETSTLYIGQPGHRQEIYLYIGVSHMDIQKDKSTDTTGTREIHKLVECLMW